MTMPLNPETVYMIVTWPDVIHVLYKVLSVFYKMGFTMWFYMSARFFASEAAHLSLPLNIFQRHVAFPLKRHKERLSRFLA
jgi:hypothetical protein